MSGQKLMIIGAAALVMLVVSSYGLRRYQALRCAEAGGSWDSRNARCRNPPVILHRGLMRS